MSRLRKYLSFLWPITTKTDSDFSGPLEITWIDGKKVLDTKNANYSYGALQNVLENGLKHIDFGQINSVLILGLGGGSVVKSIAEKFNFFGSIHAVEIDQKIIDIAKTEFDISAIKNLKIHRSDAFDFVKNSNQFYDLIIVDVFIDTEIPTIFLSDEFCENLSHICQNSLLFNLGFSQNALNQTKKVTRFFQNNSNFEVLTLEKVEEINRLLIATKRSRNVV
ncbi:spermidine synthase [Zunongwangia pacifica]|uniref:Spermine synthase n=1 Tax=Zunongwangia pacifica TaxID=2911062 RepID=A0A9X1ZNF2_9FLAO|nr:spermine synthase [Zunongwangia pacifica]MCL6217867.1 spermine synthase [Zunongwangia pacifica]